MGRIPGAQPKNMGVFAGLFVRFVYWATKRKLGKVVTPVQVVAHHRGILWGYGQMEQALMGSKQVATDLKDLAELRVATLVGCPF